MANATTKHAKKIVDPNARKLIGKKVLYIGTLICPVCDRKTRKTMASEYEGKYYCSEGCVLKIAKDENSNA